MSLTLYISNYKLLNQVPEGFAILKKIPEGITINNKNLTIKYVLNVGLMKGCSTGLEKQTRGRRRSRRSSNKKVKHGEKEEEEKSSSDDDSGIESLANFVYKGFQQII